MSSIQRLEIRGIRCFGPDDAQGIEFKKPLTVICGQNGCGKTTVIECLKYVTTGALPPNSRKGQSFVHDPKISGVSETKASIKLLFQTRSSQKAFVGKNLRLVQKRTKQEFQALDMVMKTKDPVTGKSTSQSNKCTELDRMVPAFLGVSKAILENVIFCHQEDSNWPLQEGSVLKKKFDDIFESSRYTKALEAIKNEKKRVAKDLKDATHKVELTKTHLNRFRQLSTELKKLNVQLKVIGEEVDSKDSSISALNAELKDLEHKLNSVEKMQDKLREKASAVKARNAQLSKMITEINSDLLEFQELPQEEVTQEQMATLEKELIHFETLLSAGQKESDSNLAEINDLKERQRVLEEKKARFAEKLDKEKNELVALETRKEEVKRRTTAFSRLLSNLAMNFTETELMTEIQTVISTYSSSNHVTIANAEFDSKELRQQALKKADEVLNTLYMNLSSQKQERDTELEKVSKDIDEVRKKLAEIEATEKSHIVSRQTIERKLSKLNDELDSINNSESSGFGDVEQLKLDLDRAQSQLKDHENQGSNIQELTQERSELEEEEAILTAELSKLSEVRSDVERHNSEVAVVSAKKKEFFTSLAKFNNEKISFYKTTKLNISELEKLFVDFLKMSVDLRNFSFFGDEALRISSNIAHEHENQIEDIKLKVQRKTNEKQQYSQKRMQIKGKKDGAFKALDRARKEADTLEEKLPRLSSLAVNSFTSRESADEASKELEIKADALREKYLETKIRSKVLQKYGEIILKSGSCPVCAQKISSDFENFFETDFIIPLQLNHENQLHSSITESDRSSFFTTDDSTQLNKRRKQTESGHYGNKCTVFDYKKNTEIKGTLAGGANAIFQSQRKKNDLELLETNYQNAMEDLKEFEKHKMSFMRLASLRENAIVALEKEFMSLVEEEKNAQKLEDELSLEEKKLIEELHSIQEIYDLAKSMKNSVQGLAEKAKNIDVCQKNLEKSMLRYSSSKLAKQYKPDTVLQDIKIKESKKHEVFNRMKVISKQINSYKDEASALSQRVIQLQSIYAKNQENDKRRQEILTERTSISENINDLSKKISILSQQRLPFKRNQQNLDEEKIRLRTKWEQRIKEVEQKKRNFEIDLSKLKELHQEISKSISLELDISRVTEQKQSWQRKCDEVTSDINSCKSEVETRSSDHAAQLKVMYEIKTCKKYKDEQQEYYKCVIEKSELTKRIQNAVGKLDEVEARLKEVKQELSSNKLRRERLLGQQSQVFESKESCVKDLKARELVGIEERFRNAQIDANTLRLAESDLLKFYKALDTALVKFHHIKIAEINEQIRELWSLTYKGGDIDKIAIKSDNDTAKTARASRSYNYRVVMHKGGTELDMRGRCSAGQKVLASLVIRMALGASFSADCGILALDEPTTNLDTENKQSLALALAEIIKERGEEASFQLVIITHDEEFVDLLRESTIAAGKAVFYNIKRELNPLGRYVSTIAKST